MPVLVAVILVVLALLICSEVWWRAATMHSELSRKFVHITVGSFVAFWPFWLSWDDIRALSVAFLVAVIISRRLHLFRAIHSVQRPTWGEIFFALAVGGVTFITQNKWIYLSALLQMSLADGLAAIIGLRYGQQQRYRVLGHTKSFVGTAAFLVTSFYILIVYTIASHTWLSSSVLLAMAFLSGIVENCGIFGLDDLLVPLLVATMLRVVPFR